MRENMRRNNNTLFHEMIGRMEAATSIEEIIDAQRNIRSDDPDVPYRVLTMQGLKIIKAYPGYLNKVRGHWGGIRRLVVDEDPSALLDYRAVKIRRYYLEYRPDRILLAHKQGLLKLPMNRGDTMPWKPEVDL